jgi:hypothetical protein
MTEPRGCRGLMRLPSGASGSRSPMKRGTKRRASSSEMSAARRSEPAMPMSLGLDPLVIQFIEQHPDILRSVMLKAWGNQP